MIVRSREQQDRDISQMDDDEFGRMLDGQLVDRASLGLQSTRQVGLSADTAAQLVNMNVQALMPGGLAAMAADTILQTRQAQSFRERLASAPFTSAFIAAEPLRGAVVEDSVEQLARAENFIARPTPEGRGILGALGLQPRNVAAGGVSAAGMTVRGAGETAMAAETVVPNLAARGFGPLGALMGLSDRIEQATGIDMAEETAGALMQTQAGQFLTRATAPAEAAAQAGGEVLYGAGESIMGAAEFIRPEDQTIVGQVFEGLGQLATAVAASLVPGGQAVTVTSFGMMGVDQQAQAMRANGLEPDAFPDQLIAGFAVTGASEQMRLGSMLRILPPSVRRSGVAQAVSRILGQAAEEGIQEGIEGVAHGIIQRTYDEDANPFDGVLQEMTVAGASAALFQILVEGIIPGRARSMRTEQTTTMLDEINAAVSEAPATQRSRQTVQDFIDEVGDEGSIYLSPEGVTTLYQSEGGMETLADIGLTEDDVAAAQFEGRDAQVNVGRLVTSQFYEQVRDHVRVDPGDPTAAEVQAGIMRDVLDVDLREAARMISTDIAQDEEAAQIGETVAQMLERAGRSADEARAAGSLYTAVFKGLAERTGQSARELFERVGLRVQSGMAATPSQEGAQTLDQFAGANALTADMGALDEAVRRLEAGEDASIVRQETGWFRGVDGELRFEISDEGMQFIQEPGEDGVLTGALGELVQHEELFAAYPNLRNVPATIRVGPQRRGQFDGQRLEANGATREEALAVVAHEIQHAIQQIENFARGGSPQEMAAQLERIALSPEVTAVFTGPLVDPIPGIAKRLAASIQYPEGSIADLAVEMALQRHAKGIALANGDRRRVFADLRVALTSRAEMRVGEARDQANRLIDELLATPEYQALAAALTEAARASEPFTRLDPNVQDTPYILYVRQAGEAEARDTEASLRLTAEQRRERDPESAFGVAEGQEPVMAYPFAPEQQIVTPQRQQRENPFANPRTFDQSAAPITMKPLELATDRRVRLRDIAAAFTRRHMDEYGRKLDPINNEADREIVVSSMVDEVQFQLEHGEGDAKNWYTEDIAEALRVTETIIPEIADPVYADLLLAFAAMTSPNENPINNWDMAVELTRRFIDDGVIPTAKVNPDGTPKLKADGTPTSFGLASSSAIPLANHMIRTMGVEGFVEFLQTRHSGREFAEIRQASGVYTKKKTLAAYTPKEVALRDEGLPGSWIFGPKVGEFMMNATGYDVNAVTVDLWNWRTYSRLIGGLQDYGSNKEREAGIVSGDGLNKVSRAAIREMETEVAERVGHTPSAVQALLWFFEQRLYRVHGSESDSFTFSDGARKAVERRGYYVSRASDGGDLQGQARTFDQSAVRPSPVDAALAVETFGNLQAEYTLDQIYEVAPRLNDELNNDLETIAADIGAVAVRGPMKKRATTEDKIRRKGYEHTGQLADIMRGTILIETPAQYLGVVNRLRRKYDILDEGWRMPDQQVGYYDAKLTVRFPNGMLGEVQLMPEAMFFIKNRGEGHRLYELIRAGKKVVTEGEIAEARRASYDLYKLGVSGNPIWSSMFSILEAASGNVSAKRAADILTPLSMTSPGSARTQAPADFLNMNAAISSGADANLTSTAGRYSQFQNSYTSMGSPFDPNISDKPAIYNSLGRAAVDISAGLDGTSVLFEVAPDPNNVELTERWNALPDEQRLAISADVAGTIMPRALEAVEAPAAAATIQQGGYEGATNPSISVRTETAEQALDLARVLGFALSQDSMMVVSEDAADGMEAVGIVSVRLGDMDIEQAREVYDRLWGLEEGGEKLVGGHTTIDGEMHILNYSALGNEALAARIDEALGGQYEVVTSEGHAAFVSNEEYDYAGETQTEGRAASLQQAARDLRNEAAARLEDLLGQAEAGRPIPDADGVIRVNGREYRARRPGEPLKAYMKAEIDTREAPESLPFEPGRFFDLSQPHQMVPIDQIQSSKTDEENAQGGGNAPKRFLAAYDGILEPRGPITVTANGDGTYTIVDGNGTYTAFRNYGWPAIPVQVVDGEGRVLEQGGEGPRAQIQIPAGGVLAEQDTIIRLTEAADATSFLHESGHLFLEIYAALEGDGFPEVDAIMADIRRWAGARPGEALTREQHERFAESFEAYLREGKAPAPELKTAFRKFAKWITEVYRNMTGQLPNLDPEITAIFDKMLAGQAEVAAQEVQSQRGLAEALAGIMEPDEIAKHESLRQRAAQEARDGIIDRIARRMERANRREVRERLATLRKEAREELEAQPLHKTMQAIFNGDLPQLNRAAAEAIVDASVLARLPRGKRGLLTNEGGETDLETFAELNGFNSASGMLNEMAQAERLGKAAYDLAERRAEAEGIALMTDAEIKAAAQQETFSTASSEIMQAELNALSRKAAIRGIPLAAIRQEAKRRIDTQPIEEAIKPGLYAIQSRSRHKKALREAARENWAEAVRLMQQALMHHEMARLAYKARDEIQRGRRRVARFNPSRTLDKNRYAPAIIEKIHEVFRLPGGSDMRAIQSLRDWADANPELPILLPPQVDAGRLVPSESAMTLEEFRGWRDSLLALGRIARDQSDAAAAERAERRDRLVASIQDNAGRKYAESGFGNETEQSRRGFSGFLRSASASVRRIGFLGRILDGGPEETGLFFDSVIVPLREAANREIELRTQTQDWMDDWYRRHSDVLKLNQNVYSNALGGEVTREQIFTIILNTGNESNLERLINEDRGRFSAQTVQAVLDEHGTPEVMAAAQEVWDYVDSFWPEISALERRTTGVTPTKVEPRTVRAQGQSYRGGYYPISYDPMIQEGGDVKNEKSDNLTTEFDAAMMRGGVLGRAQTRHGHTQARLTSTGRSLHLSMTALWKHLDNVAHDIAFRETFNEVGGLVGDPKVRQAIQDAIGIENMEAISDIVLRAGTGRLMPRNWADRMFRRLRTNAVAAMLGVSLRTVLTQPFGLTQSFGKLGVKRMAEAFSQLAANPQETADFAMSNSPFMRERARVMTRDIKDALIGEQARGLKNRLTAWSLLPMQITDTYGVAIPTWIAAYNEAREVRGFDHRKAARFADQMVADTQGSGDTIDLSTLQSGTEMEKMFTFMFGYFSGTLNLTYEGVQNLSRGNVGRGLFMLMMIHALQGALSGLALDGLGGDEDDPLEKRIAMSAGMGILNQFTGSVPLLREAMSGLIYGGTQPTPLGRAGDQAVRTVQDAQTVVEAAIEGELEAEQVHRLIKNAARSAGLWYGVPGTFQAARIYDTITQDDDPTVMEALITGKDQDN